MYYLIKSLRKDAKQAKTVYLATDPDREGEAIAWHLATILNEDADNITRVTFNEITKTAVQKAIKEPRNIDINLVDAQQARRVLDRIVGYKISPVLWKKVKRGLSAGRVQSVAVKLIVDREEEIENFIPEEYWNIYVDLKDEKTNKIIYEIRTDISCVYKGHELINMLYDDFLSLVNLLPDDIGDIYVRGPKKNGRNYGVCYFDSLGLTLYVWRGCIRFINVSNYDVFVND